MPDVEVNIVIVGHLNREFLVHKIVVNVVGNVSRLVPVREILIELILHVLVVHRLLGISLRHIVRTAVAARHVGDVPDSVGARAVLQRAAGESVGVAQHVSVLIFLHEVAVCKDSRIQLRTLRLLSLVLRKDVGIVDSVEQSSSINADCRLKAHLNIGIRQRLVVAFDRHIERTLRNLDFRIYQLVSLTVVKLVSPLVGVGRPCDLYFLLVERSLERFHRLCLRHTGQRRQVGIRVAVVDHKQVAVSPVVCTIAVHAATVAVARVA